MMKRAILLMGLTTAFWFAFAQGSDQKDSVSILSFEDYMALVISNHPVLQQANLQPQMAQAELMMARGMMDPKLEISRSLKQFKETTYYDLLGGTLKFPTWIPLDPKIAFDRNEGQYINPMDGLPTDNDNLQFNAGISIPVGRGLFIDERRAVIKQAKILQDMAEAERLKQANKLLFTTIKDYLEWSLTYRELLLLTSSVVIANELYQRVRLDYSFGEAAPVDTTQALITLQTRQADYQKVQYQFQAAGFKLSNHLWTDNGLPLEITSNTIPDSLVQLNALPDLAAVNSLIEWASDNHPEIQKIQGKNEQLDIDRRLAREYLKPQVDISYSLIDAPITPSGSFESPTFNDNYKLGLDVYFPLLLRKERGKLELTNLKIEGIQLETDYLRQTIINEINSRYAEMQTAQMLANQYRLMSENYLRLLNAEILNLETGESDLFKLNIQQDKYIEAQLKYLDAEVKFRKLRAELLYDAGNLYYALIPAQ